MKKKTKEKFKRMFGIITALLMVTSIFLPALVYIVDLVKNG